jgi:arabinogalactan endo-1,4-beta-galactosidase
LIEQARASAGAGVTVLASLAVVATLACDMTPSARSPAVVGVDVSALEQVEAAGAGFSDGDSPPGADALTLLRDQGFSAVRLRVWHTPPTSVCDLASATRLAKRAVGLGMEVMLDLHYSDTWADPGHQAKPAAWASSSGAALEDSVRRWTRDVVRSLHAAGAGPRWVQLGNEVSNGMLWPDGRLAGGDDDRGWQRFARLLRAAAQGVRDGAGGGPAPRCVVHFDAGGSPARTRAFAARLVREGVPFDDLGISYYPWWHGPLDSLSATLEALEGLGKGLYVLETAYPWTLAWRDTVHNVVGEDRQLLARFPADPEGQRAFFAEVIARVEASPLGRGVFYWAPEEVSTAARGSAWENATLFDAGGVMLPAGRLPAARAGGSRIPGRAP